MILRRYMGSGGYSKIPLYEHYVQLLVKEGIQEHQAKELTAILDNQVRQVIYQKSSKYLPGRDYVQMMKRYEESIGSFRQSIFTAQQDIVQNLRQDYAGLEQEISQTQLNSVNETRQLESGIQLDLNLEVKRRVEAKDEIEKKNHDIINYSSEQLSTIQKDLELVSIQARYAIMAFGSVALAAVFLYHTTS